MEAHCGRARLSSPSFLVPAPQWASIRGRKRENSDLKKRVAELSLDNQMLKDQNSKRVTGHFLGIDHLLKYSELLVRVDAAAT